MGMPFQGVRVPYEDVGVPFKGVGVHCQDMRAPLRVWVALSGC